MTVAEGSTQLRPERRVEGKGCVLPSRVLCVVPFSSCEVRAAESELNGPDRDKLFDKVESYRETSVR